MQSQNLQGEGRREGGRQKKREGKFKKMDTETRCRKQNKNEGKKTQEKQTKNQIDTNISIEKKTLIQIKKKPIQIKDTEEKKNTKEKKNKCHISQSKKPCNNFCVVRFLASFLLY